MDDLNPTVNRYVGHLVEGALRFRNELTVGTEAPDFAFPTLDGGFVRLSRFRGKSNVVLIFGSFTCGSTVTQLRAGNPPLGQLYRRYRRRGFEFYLIYSVEMHPGESVPPPSTFEQRVDHALRLNKEEKVPFPILIDGRGSYKIKLLASLLSLPHEWIHVDIVAGETRAREFLAKNPNGKIPVVELSDGRCLAESNAILNYLASETEFLPTDRYDLAKVQQWQFFEQYSH